MTLLRELFPLLDSLPEAAAKLGLTLDSDVDELLLRLRQTDFRSEVFQSFVPFLLENETKQLDALLPGLQRVPNADVQTAVRQNRARNALSRAGVATWRDLGELTPRDLRLLPNVGTLTVDHILACCIEMAIAPLASDDPRDDDDSVLTFRIDPGRIAAERAIKALRVISAWATNERNIERLGDLWQLDPDGGTLPADLSEMWAEFANMPPGDLADAALRQSQFQDLIDDLLLTLDDTQREVYKRRVLAPKPETLEEVGRALGFTRERARQIQLKAIEHVDASLHSDPFRPLRWRASDLRSVLGLAALTESEDFSNAIAWCVRDVVPERRDIATQLLLHIAGPYKERDGWMVLVDAPVVDARELTTLADDDGLLTVESAYGWLSSRGVDAAFQDAWIDRSDKFRRFGDRLAVWSGSLVDKCVAILAVRTFPATAEDLVAEVGQGNNVKGARDRFFSDVRLMRVNRTQWALRSWGLEEYTGIADEIAQRIETAGGRGNLQDIVAELTVQFGVRESSVKVYAEAPMFVVEDGWVRLRREDEPFTVLGSISSCRGCFISGVDRLSLVSSVDSDTLRGSGRSCPAPVADLMGISPGQRRTFRWAGGELVVTWPTTAAFGPSLGSTRALVASVEAADGDSVRFDFDLFSGSVTCSRVPRSLTGLSDVDALKVLTGLELENDDALDRLSAALQVPRSEVRRRLSERGDTAVLAHLPTTAVDAPLAAALSDLAGLLDDLN